MNNIQKHHTPNQIDLFNQSFESVYISLCKNTQIQIGSKEEASNDNIFIYNHFLGLINISII